MKKQFPLTPRVPLVPFNVELLLCHWVTFDQWCFDLYDPFWRIYWMAQKGWSIRFNGKLIPLLPEQLVIVPPNTACSSESSGQATQFHVHFTTSSIINPFKPGVYSLPLKGADASLITAIMKQSPTSLKNRLSQTLWIKQLCYRSLARLPDESLNIRSYSPKISSVMELMVQNLKKPLANEVLAKAIGMNTNAFIDLFHREVDLSPQKWAMEKRLEQVALLLSHTHRSMDEIAETYSFTDRSHLSRVFKKFRGVGPAAYRRNRMTVQANRSLVPLVKQ